MGRVLAWVVGIVRAVTGVVLLAVPEESAERWAGASGPTVAYFVRGIGGRDLVIGVGLVHALVTERDPRPWLTASVLGDATDALAASSLGEEHAGQAAAIAGGFGFLGGIARALVRD